MFIYVARSISVLSMFLVFFGCRAIRKKENVSGTNQSQVGSFGSAPDSANLLAKKEKTNFALTYNQDVDGLPGFEIKSTSKDESLSLADLAGYYKINICPVSTKGRCEETALGKGAFFLDSGFIPLPMNKDGRDLLAQISWCSDEPVWACRIENEFPLKNLKKQDADLVESAMKVSQLDSQGAESCLQLRRKLTSHREKTPELEKENSALIANIQSVPLSLFCDFTYDLALLLAGQNPNQETKSDGFGLTGEKIRAIMLLRDIEKKLLDSIGESMGKIKKILEKKVEVAQLVTKKLRDEIALIRQEVESLRGAKGVKADRIAVLTADLEEKEGKLILLSKEEDKLRPTEWANTVISFQEWRERIDGTVPEEGKIVDYSKIIEVMQRGVEKDQTRLLRNYLRIMKHIEDLVRSEKEVNLKPLVDALEDGRGKGDIPDAMRGFVSALEEIEKNKGNEVSARAALDSSESDERLELEAIFRQKERDLQAREKLVRDVERGRDALQTEEAREFARITYQAGTTDPRVVAQREADEIERLQRIYKLLVKRMVGLDLDEKISNRDKISYLESTISTLKQAAEEAADAAKQAADAAKQAALKAGRREALQRVRDKRRTPPSQAEGENKAALSRQAAQAVAGVARKEEFERQLRGATRPLPPGGPSRPFVGVGPGVVPPGWSLEEWDLAMRGVRPGVVGSRVAAVRGRMQRGGG
ncbi:MAG: hypothetical protein KA436_02895 [Oligoflexales bacterium]|nr:hypothetical protein [Oligoflexales bacterium]